MNPPPPASPPLQAHPPRVLPATVTTIPLGSRTLHIIGTAHISQRSVEDVRETIALIKPDTVCVELDEARHKALMNKEAWREMDLVQVIRKKQATLLLTHLVLSAFQRKLGEHLGIQPGAEMACAVESTREAGAELVLADRDIRTTLRRTWARLGWMDKFRLAYQFLGALVLPPDMDAVEIEQLKEKDMLSQVMETFAREFPRAKEVLIDERDTWLSDRILTAPGQTVVAVVGAGHVPGILRHMSQHPEPVDLKPLAVIPPPGLLGRALGWGIPLLVLGLIGYGFTVGQAAVSLDMILVWVLATGSLAALGTAAALGHPLSILSAFLAAPLTTLHPLLAAGWVAGLVEALVRRPRVRDFESLPTDMVTLRGFWRNGITRILLVVVLANLGATVGVLIGIPLMTRLLS